VKKVSSRGRQGVKNNGRYITDEDGVVISDISTWQAMVAQRKNFFKTLSLSMFLW
jgi:hypothetical protein